MMVLVAVVLIALGLAAYGAISTISAVATAMHVAAAQQTLLAADVEARTYYVDHSAPPPVDLLGRATPYGAALDDGSYGLAIQASPGGDGWTIIDSRPYPASALVGLRRWDGTLGDAPAGTCDDDAPCTHVADDSSGGIVGAP